MSEPRRGRAPHAYTIRRVRLVNFHNFVDETVEVSEGGHLFLLGDNGSGKTTVLDAIHLALTGALDVELNAAARVAGGRDAGRSLQGVVLRYDAEKGVRNQGGAVGYALVELVDSTEGAVVCIGVGIEATTMEADVTRWAVLRRGPLEEVQVVEERPEGRVPLARDRLRAGLDKLDVFLRMSEYRKALAERLFGGEALYEEVCRFWSMAKAYREIVSRARDFAGLFRRLLPAPDAQVFHDILSSLRALDELEGLLERVERQRGYVASISTLVTEIAVAREEIARYRWLITLRRDTQATAELEHTRAELVRTERNLSHASALVSAAEGAVDQAREALRTAAGSDQGHLLDRFRECEAQLKREAGDVELAREALVDAESKLRERERALSAAFDERSLVLRDAAAELLFATEAARSLEHPLGRTLALAQTERERASQLPPASEGLSPIDPRARVETERLLDATNLSLLAREAELSQCQGDLAARQSELFALEQVDEEAPRVFGFAAARAALLDANIAAQPLFELLEPRAGALSGELGALEALLGDEALASFVVAKGDLSAARARALAHPGARVIVSSAPDSPAPEWVRSLFSAGTDAELQAVVGTLLSQASSLGSVTSPDELGDVEHRGTAVRVGGRAPRLLGIDARRRAHQTSVRGAREAAKRADSARVAAEAARDAARAAQASALRVRRAEDELRGPEVLALQSKCERAQDALVHAAERADEARARHASSDARRQESALLVAALRARVRDAGIEELERHLDELRANEGRAVLAHKQALRREAEASERLADLGRALAVQLAEVERLASVLGVERAALRAALAALGRPEREFDDAGLERWVRVTQRGDQFSRIEKIEERLRESDRREAAACSEIAGDGSRGIRNLEWAGHFGFGWSSIELVVLDRRGDPLPSVLAKIDRELGEQREVVNAHTCELMDKLVMGDLARELQEQVERLYLTVREINDLLGSLRFGATRYQFKVAPHDTVQELVALVRKVSVLDETSRTRFREFIDERLDDIRRPDSESEVPELLDYRRWFDYRLSMSSSAHGDTELTRELRALGSGGEQGVPNYLLVLALAKLMFDNAGARVRPLLFDEAFYGIDAGRRDQLLRFATELGLQLVVASPDQDGVTPSVQRTTTLFLIKDDHGDVHSAPYHYWNDTGIAQQALFPTRAEEPNPGEAVCVVGAAATS